jgi:lipoyl(octanoyl) transferase
MSIPWLYLDAGEQPGAAHMAADEDAATALLRGASRPLLRLYRWRPHAISLGYNQDAGDIDRVLCAADGIDVVRRPTGGRAILHAEELTYAVVMPAQGGILDVYNDISRALVRGLRLFGVDVDVQRSQPDFRSAYRTAGALPCFTSSARYEIEWRGRKLVGSAQRRYRDGAREVVLQHGSILTGPAHRRLVRYLRVDHDTARSLDAEMERRTADLHLITGAPVDAGALTGCIRRGFEEEWGITFTHSPEHAYASHTEETR